jgi:hypothetical protein
MQSRPDLFLIAGLIFAATPAHADITIVCGGYAPKINDHVEWELRISGTEADWGDGKRFKASETRRFYIVTRPGTEIRINKAAKSYVMYGPMGAKAAPIEWSRKVSGEGCEIPKAGSQP